MEFFQKIKYALLKRKMNIQKRYNEEIKKYDDELFNMYYEIYEKKRISEYGENDINKSENEMLEIDAYYAWCDEIIEMQPQLKKADKRYKFVHCGVVPIAVGASLVVATGVGAASAGAAVAGAVFAGAGIVQAIKARQEQKHYFLNHPSRGRYYFTHIYKNKPVDLRLGYRKQVFERFANEHHVNCSARQKTL